MLSDFRDFILRGNVVALAVAVVIGVAFGAVITSFVENIITPLIAAIGGQPDFSDLSFTINDSIFRYGLFINALIAFLIIAAVVFFLVVRPVNKLMKRYEEEDLASPPEYESVSAGSGGELATLVTKRAEDGWRVVSVERGADGAQTALLVRE
jgi:large conductance mechanosensitive channel